VRILGEVKKEYADLLRRADAIFIEELRNFRDDASGKNWYELTNQAFAVFLPVKSVGVMGDGRTYDYVVALRAVQTADALDKYATCVEKAYAISAADLGKSRWNAPGLSLSAAYALRFPDGELSTGGREAASTWLSFAGPLGEDGQGGVAIAWSQGLNEEIPNEVGLTVLGRMGVQRARIRAEPGLIVSLADGGPTLRVPVVFGGELGVGEDTWIHTRFGLVIDPDADEVSLLSSATFRWGQASEPSFKAE
jgi:hypothetical protein